MIANRVSQSRKKARKILKGRAARVISKTGESNVINKHGKRITKVAPGDSFKGVNEMNKKVLELLNNQ